MNPCETCPIEDKIYECCGRFPDSGESVLLQISESILLTACPWLDRHGRCIIYEDRPLGCRAHYCSRYSSFREFGGIYKNILSSWGHGEENE